MSFGGKRSRCWGSASHEAFLTTPPSSAYVKLPIRPDLEGTRYRLMGSWDRVAWAASFGWRMSRWSAKSHSK